MENHQDYQVIWEVKREPETTFIQSEEEIKGESNCCLQLAGERNGLYRRWSQIFLRGVYSGKMRCNEHKLLHRNSCIHTRKKSVHGEGDKPLKQVAQRGFGISICGHIQSSTVYSTGQSALPSFELL